MSFFAVTIEKISEIKPHPNADRLELGRLEGIAFQFVIPKDVYKVGDLVVYFPIDSLLPDDLIKNIGLEGKLSGSGKNRIKTIKLRGSISQGLVISIEDISSFIMADLVNIIEALDWTQGTDITNLLGVKKYEAPEELVKGAMLHKMPDIVNVYDIEGCDRNNDIVEQYMMNEYCFITEKLEGSHFSATIYTNGNIIICQRRHEIKQNEEQLNNPAEMHTWFKVAKEAGLFEKLPQIIKDEDVINTNNIQAFTIRGEVIGPNIQKNIYNLQHHEVRFFEIEINGIPVEPATFYDICAKYELRCVPILNIDLKLKDWLDEKTIQQAANGKSLINPNVLREGIVIRPFKEQYVERFGRVILKQRDSIYLSENDF